MSVNKSNFTFTNNTFNIYLNEDNKIADIDKNKILHLIDLIFNDNEIKTKIQTLVEKHENEERQKNKPSSDEISKDYNNLPKYSLNNSSNKLPEDIIINNSSFDIKEYIKNNKNVLYDIYMLELNRLYPNEFNLYNSMNNKDNELYNIYDNYKNKTYSIDYGFLDDDNNKLISVMFNNNVSYFNNNFKDTIIMTLLSYVNIYKNKRDIDYNNIYKLYHIDLKDDTYIQDINIYFNYILNVLIINYDLYKN